MMMNREEFNKEIESIKEVLSNMPQNNKKNKKKYLDYINDNLSKYRELEDNIIKSFNKRNDDIEKKKGKGGIDFSNSLEKKKKYLDDLFCLNEWNTPYEKIGMDKIVYEINHYYKDNLESLNNDINDAIECFNKVGVKLKSDDFNFSKYVHQYMEVILSQDSKKAKAKMDEMFWKSPNMIHGIAMNFNYLYIKYEKYFINYYKNLSKKILSSSNKDKLLEEYNKLLDEIDVSNYSIVNISDKLFSGELNIKDYSSDKLESYLGSLGSKNLDMDIVLKLYYSLYEYKMYMEYKFIIDKVIELYKNKASFKNSYKNLMKDINKIYGNIFKVNKKINSKWFHNKDKDELLDLELNNKLDELSEKDSNLCLERVNEVIGGLNDGTSYLDILNLIGFNYVYFRNIIVENQEGITYDEVVQKQDILKEFLCSNKLGFLDNIKILEEANIPQIIGDRYKLLDINISQEEIENNYLNYMDIIDKIRVIDSINNSDVSYEELLFQINIKDIIKK